MPTILIGGYYGAGNVGDEAILAAMLAELRARYQNRGPLSFIILSWNPEKTSRELDVEATHWKDINGMVEAARRSDLIIVGGGGIFHDYWGIDPETYLRKSSWDITAFGSLTLLAKLLDIPCMIYGVGVGPFKSDVAREHTRLAFERCQVATLRDEESLEFLQGTGFDTHNASGPLVKILPDPVYALTTSSEDERHVTEFLQNRGIPAEIPLLGISLHYWDRSGPPEKWLPTVAAGVRQFLEQNKQAQVIGIPFHVLEATPYTNDAIVHKQLADFIDLPGRVHLIDESINYLFVQALIQRCTVLLTMRLHEIIMGTNVGTPCVALASRPKIRAAMKIARLEKFCNATLTPRTTVLKAQLQESWDQRPELSRQMLALSSDLRRKTAEHARLALDLISRSHHPVVGFAQEFALEQVRLLQKADEAHEVLEKERFDLQTSVWDLAAQIQNKDVELLQLRNRIQDLDTQVQTQESELQKQKPHSLELELRVQTQAKELRQQKIRFLRQEAKSQTQKSELHEQKAQLLEMEAQAQIQESSLQQQKEQLQELRAQVEKKDGELNQQHNRILEMETLIYNPEGELQRLRAKLAEIEIQPHLENGSQVLSPDGQDTTPSTLYLWKQDQT